MRANMQDEISAGTMKARALKEEQNNFLRIYTQHQRLLQEYQAVAVDVFRKAAASSTQRTRSVCVCVCSVNSKQIKRRVIECA